MDKMICSCCGATLVPTTLTTFLTCEYCDSSVANPYYDQAAAAEAEKPSLQEICLSTLKEMGASQNLASIDADCFGDPIDGVNTARIGLSIPDSQQMYFLYAHNILLLGFSDGFALTEEGLYYDCGSGSGALSWETFITGAISCVDEANGQDGTLKIGSSLEIAVKNEKDSRLARFLVDFHNQVYHQHTGETAPAAWCVTEPAAAQTYAQTAEANDPSLLDMVLPGIGALLGGTRTRRTVVQRTPSMHPTSRPTVRQDRRERIEPPRPLHTQPHHRPTGNNGASALGRQIGVKNQRTAAPARPGSDTLQRQIGMKNNASAPARPRSETLQHQAGMKSNAPARPGSGALQRHVDKVNSAAPARPGQRRPGSSGRPRPGNDKPGRR